MKNSDTPGMQRLFNICFLGLVAVLPMSDTIALRNLLLLVLVCLVLFSLIWRQPGLAVPWVPAWRQVPWVVRGWVIFLLLFPLWAVQRDAAWHNLLGQWLESLLAGLVGWGAVVLLGRRGPSLWALGLASTFALAVLLLLCLAAGLGLLGADFYADPRIVTLWSSISLFHTEGLHPVLRWQNFMEGFRGIEPMHGNLGYTACQAIVLVGVCLCMGWSEADMRKVWASGAVIFLSFLSLFIAHSRGAILYGVLMLILTVLIYAWKARRSTDEVKFSKEEPLGSRWGMRFAAALAVLLFLFVGWQYVQHDLRWRSMADKVKLAMLSDTPLQLICEGISSQNEARVQNDFAHGDAAYARVLLDGLKDGDGGRVLLMRAGFGLLLENPRGLDGSRHSYRKLVEAKCGHPPAFQYAHSHESWIDLGLALGWMGLLLFALMWGYFLRSGWHHIGQKESRPWAMALLLISIFWMLRGFADSVYREHYLQMQMVLLMYLHGRMILASRPHQEASAISQTGR